MKNTFKQTKNTQSRIFSHQANNLKENKHSPIAKSLPQIKKHRIIRQLNTQEPNVKQALALAVHENDVLCQYILGLQANLADLFEQIEQLQQKCENINELSQRIFVEEKQRHKNKKRRHSI